MTVFNGDDGPNTYFGTPLDDRLFGNGGDDMLYGNDGDDSIFGGVGRDMLFGGNGSDRITASDDDMEQDVVDGGAGYDFITAGYNDIIRGGADSATLTLVYTGWTTPFVGTFLDSSDPIANGTGTIEDVSSISLLLTSLDDVVRPGGAILRSIRGGGGDDIVYGGATGLSFNGGPGNDRFVAGRGQNDFEGVAGYDTINYAGERGAITVVGDGVSGGRLITRTGPTGQDYILSVENLIATRFGDTIEGDDGTFRYDGQTGRFDYVGGGRDRIAGDAGNDVINGLGGEDRLFGGDGDDILNGGQQRDFLDGGTGADKFVFSASSGLYSYRDADSGGPGRPADQILDFNSGEGDRIDLSAIDGDINTSTPDTLIFIGSARPTMTAGEVWYDTIEGDSFVHIDTDGDAVSDLDIRVVDVAAFTASDFIF